MPETGWKRYPEEVKAFMASDEGRRLSTPNLRLELIKRFNFDRTVTALGQYCHQRGWLRLMSPWSMGRVVGPPPRINPAGGLFCFSDAHTPAHDADWMNRCADLGASWGIQRAVSIGDFANMDALTRWERHEVGYTDEQKGSRRAIEIILEMFETDLVLGNHCLRLARELGWKMSARKAVLDYLGYDEDDERLHVYQHRCCVVWNSWRLEHAKRTSMIACGPAHNMCAQHQMCAVTAHSHTWGAVQDVTGKYLAIDIGHCANPRKLDYLQQQTFGRTQPCQGALILQPGEDGHIYPYHLHPKYTDFAALKALGGYYRAVNEEASK